MEVCEGCEQLVFEGCYHVGTATGVLLARVAFHLKNALMMIAMRYAAGIAQTCATRLDNTVYARV